MTGRFEPARVVVLDVADPIPPLPARGADGRWYRRVVALVRIDGAPIGVADLDIGTGLGPVGVAEAVWAALRPEIRAHRGDPALTALPVSGFGRPQRVRPADRGATVVIATRDRPNELARCLTSLLELDHDRFDVVVVDNAPSDDRSRDLVAQFGAGRADVRYVREPRPGLARAHNAARPFVTGDVVAITDDDVVVDRAWLRRLTEAFDAGPSVGAVTGMIFPAELETEAQAWTDVHAAYNKGYERRVVGLDDDPSSLLPWATGTIGSGANMAFSVAALDDIGWFDDALGAGTPARGGDDLAAFHDVLVHGHQIVYEPSAVIFHHHHRDARVVRDLAFSYGVALGAHLTRALLDHPASVVDLLPRLPAGLRHGAAVTRRPGATPVAGLDGVTWRQRAGVLAGPWSYARSRRRARSAGVAA